MFQADKEATKITNRSGFPLQIAIGDLVSTTRSRRGWRVSSQEQAWSNPDTGSNGFADLILKDSYGTTLLNIECKRVQNSEWLFLLPETSPKERAHFKAWVSFVKQGKPNYVGWFDLIAEPNTYESLFCVINGQDPKARPMLERVASEVVESTEAIANAEISQFDSEELRVYFNVIVTTAKLKICKFAPSEISISTGDISDLQSSEVGYLRFRKQLTTHNLDKENPQSVFSRRGQNDSSVFIVNSEHLLEFL